MTDLQFAVTALVVTSTGDRAAATAFLRENATEVLCRNLYLFEGDYEMFREYELGATRRVGAGVVPGLGGLSDDRLGEIVDECITFAEGGAS